MKSGETIYLIDASAFIYRAFHALPPFERSDGAPIGTVKGYCEMLWGLLTRAQAATVRPSHIAVVFDAGRKTFRNDIYPDYKAHRPPQPPELTSQLALIREATAAFNLPSVEMVGYEADDLIATYARMAVEDGAEVVVVTPDKDLFQLVGPCVRILYLRARRIEDPKLIKPGDDASYRWIGISQVVEKWGVGPRQVTDVQALVGDATDNIPGVRSIGEKTATALIQKYGTLGRVMEAAWRLELTPKISAALNTDSNAARLSKLLVTLKYDVPVTIEIDDFAVRGVDGRRLVDFLRSMELVVLTERVMQATGVAV